MEAAAADVDPETGAHRVQVFYATDRRPLGEETVSLGFQVYAATIAGGVVTVLFGLATVFLRRRVILGVMTGSCALVTALFLHSASLETQKDRRLVDRDDRVYGSDRHETGDGYLLEVGVCQVSLPPDHRVGAVESPSILRLEFRENPEKHVVLDRVVRQEEDAFYDELGSRIQQSPARQAFVFVHGYNVEFESAVKRTAQIAFDLKFVGAPICYSWPSKGGLAEYTRDESNVTWTVTHLEHFLNQVVHRTGARTVHLVAHSMGNRAVVQALERMALQQNPSEPMFGQLVMAAPDVDAAEFRDRYAPAVMRMARHVTLYASANDRALVASTKVHGHTRAGLSGASMTVIEGIETVDVSPIDTSLIGHSYYGDNPLMIRDMQALVELNQPAAGRPWLERIARSPSLAYWVFRRGFDGGSFNVGRGITGSGLHR
jgi:esterase/lipase superfamily enzyme